MPRFLSSFTIRYMEQNYRLWERKMSEENWVHDEGEVKDTVEKLAEEPIVNEARETIKVLMAAATSAFETVGEDVEEVKIEHGGISMTFKRKGKKKHITATRSPYDASVKRM